MTIPQAWKMSDRMRPSGLPIVSRQHTNYASFMAAFDYGHRSQADTIKTPQARDTSRKLGFTVVLVYARRPAAPYDVGCEFCKQVAEN